jgi:beta-lactamase class A
MKKHLLPQLILLITSSLIFSCNSSSTEKKLAADSSSKTKHTVDTAALSKQIQTIASSIDGNTGVAILDLKNGTTVNWNGDKHFPMQSVFKFPLALAILDQVDKGKLSLDQMEPLTAADRIKNTWSPLRDKYEGKNDKVSIREILSFTVSQSDNNGCDLLFRLLGGPKSVNDHIHSIGINDINIVATEADMHKEWNVQYNNWSTPVAMTQLLKRFYQDPILSRSSHDTLWNMMVATTTGPKRIKGLLPEGTIVPHKTGTSDTKDGLTGAINDAGIIMLPDGRPLIITIFVSNSKAGSDKMETVIAQIAKAAWDSFK